MKGEVRRSGIDDDGNWFDEITVPASSLFSRHTMDHFGAQNRMIDAHVREGEKREACFDRITELLPELAAFRARPYDENYNASHFLAEHPELFERPAPPCLPPS